MGNEEVEDDEVIRNRAQGVLDEWIQGYEGAYKFTRMDDGTIRVRHVEGEEPDRFYYVNIDVAEEKFEKKYTVVYKAHGGPIPIPSNVPPGTYIVMSTGADQMYRADVEVLDE